ncbi:MAG: hypothetical protein OEN23_13855 [Paracoccaceae bacterium]|nr:hypothetical protein [Paracoccaceae bacterium]
MLRLTLKWPYCPDGVELHDYGPRSDGGPLLSGELSGQHVRYKTNRREWANWKIDHLEAPLVLQFVNAKTDAELLGFLSVHGLTTGGWSSQDGGREVEWSTVKANQSYLRTQLLQIDYEESAEKVGRRINRLIASHPNFSLAPRLEFTSGRSAPHFGLSPQSLLGFMLMEIFLMLDAGARSKPCLRCRKLFVYGHLTGRRSTAKYCADRCRVAAMAQRNREKDKRV